MPYNFATESFYTKKLCSRLSSRKKNIFIRKTVTLRFEAPFGSLGTTFAVQLRLIRKLVVDFLLAIIELFSLGVFFLSQCTRLTDGRTYGRTVLRSPIPRCIQCSALNSCFTHVYCRITTISATNHIGHKNFISATKNVHIGHLSLIHI